MIRFPFTTLSKSKKRPVLIIKDPNHYGDFLCFQITSNAKQSYLYPLNDNDYQKNSLPLASYVKYDKCFTLNQNIVEKRLASLKMSSLETIKELFCKEI